VPTKMPGRVIIRTQGPIRRSASVDGFLLLVGILLLLYPLSWIFMLQYRPKTVSPPVSILHRAVDAVGYLVLDLAPRLANGGLALFLAVFFCSIARLKQQRQMR
jgi:hypothetical protein